MKTIYTDRGFAEKLTYAQLMRYTNNFSEKNLLGTFQFGRVYRGKYDYVPDPTKYFMVKIWEVSETSHCFFGDMKARMMREILLLQHEGLNCHLGVLEFYGYCCEDEHIAVVYLLNPLDTVHNLVPKDSFTWLQRIKVALVLADLLKFLHTRTALLKPLLVRNIDATHIVLDKQYNVKVFDFSMISGGFFSDTTDEDYYLYRGCIGPQIECSGEWSEKTDVFSFGVLLLNLITRKINTEEDRLSGISALRLYQLYYSDIKTDSNSIKTPFHSLGDQSFTLDNDFSVTDGREITALALKCIHRVPDERPTMKQVVGRLLKLDIVKKHAEFLGLGSEFQARVDS